MGKIKVAINGFGRIGRVTFRAIQAMDTIEVIAINDLTDSGTLAHLLKYDSIHGIFDGTIKPVDDGILINGKKVTTYNERSPNDLPWKELGIDVVLESTGLFKDEASASLHLEAGAKRVIISAPPGSGNIKSVVLGINDDILAGDEKIVSNASCTTNCAAPMVKILDENWGVEQGYITTIHSYTGDQRLHDAPHKDLRRARAATQSIIPTSTGAAKAITKIFPHLTGKLGGCGIRVPVPDGSLTDLTCTINKEATIEEINSAFRKAASGNLKGILEYTDEPIVGIDTVGNPHSCIFDSLLTSVLGRVVKIVGWYDNESGYSARLAELIERVGKVKD
ncbi:MAG TPA: type I glyceraldehyde-3-phosphate dehydrogenase [Flavobacteriales bacterium]|nr:type I glyceraldehyde-3-phosphate dehydrogenase [Flavobacteriales bacterium]HIN39410.1 type I glyceraldehyde-3-phosphate dehydrogenase [Flavobacteriales bacterium]